MSKWWHLPFASFLLLSLAQAQGSAPWKLPAEIADGHGGHHIKWDMVQDRAVLYRDIQQAEVPAARIVREDGSTLPVYPLADLPQANELIMWDAAATPEGGIVLAAVAVYDKKPTGKTARPLLLTYGSDGHLLKLWNVAPYEFHLIAVDTSGNVFGFGGSNLSSKSNPMLIEYSPEGAVVRESLPANTFPMGADVDAGDALSGQNHMFIKQDELVLWTAKTQEIIVYDLHGNQQSRTSVHDEISRVSPPGTARFELHGMGLGSNGQIIAQAEFWPKRPTSNATIQMISFSTAGTNAAILSSGSSTFETEFLGVSRQGKLKYLERGEMPPSIAEDILP